MSTSTARRPLPALAFLLALTVLTAIVWWRVLHRPDGSSNNTAAGPSTVQPTCSPVGTKKVTLPKPAAVTVTVLNASNRYHLATDVSTLLKARGFKTGTPNDFPSQLSGIGEIQYGKAGKNGATLLGYYLPGAALVAESRSDAGVTLVLGAAYHALATPAAVTKSLASAAKPCANS